MTVLIICLSIYLATVLLNLILLYFGTNIINSITNIWAFLYVILSPLTVGHTVADWLITHHQAREALDSLTIDTESGLKFKWRSSRDYLMFIQYMSDGDEGYIEKAFATDTSYIEVVMKAIEDDVLVCKERFKTLYLCFNEEILIG